MNNIVRIGRQPILGVNSELVSYELLFRDSNDNAANVIDGDAATLNVITNTLFEFGLEQVVGDVPAFINLTKNYLNGSLPIELPHDRFVLEVLEDVVIDDEVVAGLRRLSEQGFRIALDDFVFSPPWEPCLEIADIIKLDILNMTRKEIMTHVAFLKQFDLTLLAEKVETNEDYQFCKNLGFDLYQGYFFTKPNILETQQSSSNQAAIIQTLAAVNDPAAEADDIEKAISLDPTLALKLLRYVNSSAFGRRNKIESLRQAIVYLGKDKIRQMASLLMMNSIDGKPTALIKTSLIRALTCQKLAQSLKFEKEDAFYSVGLLSTLDALLDKPLNEIISALPLTEEFQNALLHQEGPMGRCLKLAIAFEQSVFDALISLDIKSDEAYSAYMGALNSVELGEGMAGLLSVEKSSGNLEGILTKRKCLV